MGKESSSGFQAKIFQLNCSRYIGQQHPTAATTPNMIPMNSLLSRRSSFAEGENATDHDHNGATTLSDNWNGGGHRKVDTAVLATSSMGGGTPRYRGSRGAGGSSRGGSSDHRAGGMGMGQNSSQHRIFGSQEEYGAIRLGTLQASAIR